MKRQATVLLASLMLLSAPVFAQTSTPADPSRDAPAGSPPADTSAAPGTTLRTTIIAPDGYTVVSDMGALTTEQVTGVTVNGPDGRSIGEVVDVDLGAAGGVNGLVADVGGFLGMGEHRVLLTFDQASLFTSADGSMIAVSSLTEEELKALPEYVPQSR